MAKAPRRKPKKEPKKLSFGIRPAPKISRFSTYVEGLDSTSWAETGRWVGVISSKVSAISYSRRSLLTRTGRVVDDRLARVLGYDIGSDPYRPTGEGQLFVLFNSGLLYRYDNVPQSVAENMFNCSSIGSYVSQRLKGYNYTIVK